MPTKRSVSDMDVEGRTVLVRVDYNVTFRPDTTEISDDSRIRATLPTLDLLKSRDAKIVLCSHLGRPKGRVVEELRMKPVAVRLANLLKQEVISTRDCVGSEVSDLVSSAPQNSVVMLENLRFHPGEENNESEFAEELAALADVYVNDAFGTAHRAHASTFGITQHLDSAVGLLMERELHMLGKALENPARPFSVALGGAKVSDKVRMIEHLADKVDTFLIGGGMASAFLATQGLTVGASRIEDASLKHARNVTRMGKERGFNLIIPSDVVIADRFERDASSKTVISSNICESWLIMDIGDETARRYRNELQRSNTIFWNGPMGVFEWESFSKGTTSVARSVAGAAGTSIIGGGSTADAVYTLGLEKEMSHVSTGGGASLEYLEGRDLPGVSAIQDA
ncbi:MAG: phosphoglycerate kinase [Dehalococcoidia bacterium]|nr:phosphoglycerate kinase [Dehalococcoidia bacterium]